MSLAPVFLVVDIRSARRIVSDLIHSTLWCSFNQGTSGPRSVVASTEVLFAAPRSGHK